MDLAKFLAFLYDQGKAASTIRVHRAAICTTLRQLGQPTFSENNLIRDTLRGASNYEARNPRRCPSWDLFLVLNSLKGSPYEPLAKAELKFLSFKTLFLIALASGRRMSEVTNFSGLAGDIAREPDGSFTLKFLPEFLAKNQRPGDPSTVIRIPPLTPGPEAKLCPVRALKRYLLVTRSFRGKKRQLFISLNPKYEVDVSVNALSRWARETISRAYQDGPPSSSKPHELRAWSASLALSRNVSMIDILAAAYWKSPSTFTNHYLRDVSQVREDGLFSLSPLAIAQRVVAP